MNFSVPDFPQTFPTLMLGYLGVKKFVPSLGPQDDTLFGIDVHDFRHGCP